MTTKEQEKKALEQIKKIVDGLGEGSYIGMAFEGCFEIAEENIENDWGCSMKDNWEAAKKENGKLREIAANQQEEIRVKEEGLNNLQHIIEVRDRIIEDKSERISDLNKQLDEACNTSIKNWNNFREQEDKVAELEQEIIKLKAKLYDLMVKE